MAVESVTPSMALQQYYGTMATTDNYEYCANFALVGHRHYHHQGTALRGGLADTPPLSVTANTTTMGTA